MDITCPSGLRGTIRKLKVSDQKLTKDPKLVKHGKFIQELCRACWVTTIDPGPYTFPEGHVVWDDLLQGDAFYIFMKIRQKTFGNDYELTPTCPHCKKDFIHVVNVEDDLPAIPPSDDGLESFKSGVPMETEHPVTGQLIQFRMLQDKDTKVIERLKETFEFSQEVASMITRITYVDGVGNKHLQIMRWVEQLDMDDVVAINDEIEYHDCGIDTDIEMKCTHCEEVTKVALPLSASFFKASGRKSKVEKRKARARRVEKEAETEEAMDLT